MPRALCFGLLRLGVKGSPMMLPTGALCVSPAGQKDPAVRRCRYLGAIDTAWVRRDHVEITKEG